MIGLQIPDDWEEERLDTIYYVDRPHQRHNLIQTISRVHRKFEKYQLSFEA